MFVHHVYDLMIFEKKKKETKITNKNNKQKKKKKKKNKKISVSKGKKAVPPTKYSIKVADKSKRKVKNKYLSTKTFTITMKSTNT